MKRSLLIVALAGFFVSAGAWLFAQSAKPAPTPTPPPNSANVPFGTVEALQPQPAQSPVVPLQPTAKPEELTSSPTLKTTTVEAINLRSRYSELSKKKAQLMKEDQLKREIETLERQIPELEAWAKAEEAVQLLREVVEKHPNTEAAKSAQTAIELIQGHGEDFRREEIFAPRPDSGTNRRLGDPRPVAEPRFDDARPRPSTQRLAKSSPLRAGADRRRIPSAHPGKQQFLVLSRRQSKRRGQPRACDRRVAGRRPCVIRRA
jgi:hypothetical protein